MIDRVLRVTELSVTGLPSHPLTGFSAAEVKALTDCAGIDAVAQRLAIIRARRAIEGFRTEANLAGYAAARARAGLL